MNSQLIMKKSPSDLPEIRPEPKQEDYPTWNSWWRALRKWAEVMSWVQLGPVKRYFCESCGLEHCTCGHQDYAAYDGDKYEG